MINQKKRKNPFRYIQTDFKSFVMENDSNTTVSHDNDLSVTPKSKNKKWQIYSYSNNLGIVDDVKKPSRNIHFIHNQQNPIVIVISN